jgi:predicted RNase H-like HicB family nuclease
MKTRQFPVVIEATSTGFSAYSPDVRGCVAAGATDEEARLNFQAALNAHFEITRQLGGAIPEPKTSVDYVEVES